jgi:hypothetical protein
MFGVHVTTPTKINHEETKSAKIFDWVLHAAAADEKFRSGFLPPAAADKRSVWVSRRNCLSLPSRQRRLNLAVGFQPTVGAKYFSCRVSDD